MGNMVFQGYQPTDALGEKCPLLNSNDNAMQAAALFGWNQYGSSALTWAYFGGAWPTGQVAGGTLAMAPNATNYIQAALTGSTIVSCNQTGFSPGQIPLFTVVTDGQGPTVDSNGNVTGVTDMRPWVSPQGTPFCAVAAINAAGNANITLNQAQAAARVLVFSGALTGNILAFLPLAQALYVVNNETTGTPWGGGSPPASNTATLPAPVQSAPTTSTTGGTLAAATYYYKITALDAAGETVPSNEQSITTTGTTSTVSLSWGAVAGATSYRVYRGTTSGGENVYYAPGNVTSYTDTGATSTSGSPPASNTATIPAPVQNSLTSASGNGALVAGTYYYEVTAYNAAGETVASNEQNITVTGSTSAVTVSWSAVAGATSYKVYRGTSAGAENVFVAPGNVTSYVDTGLYTLKVGGSTGTQVNVLQGSLALIYCDGTNYTAITGNANTSGPAGHGSTTTTGTFTVAAIGSSQTVAVTDPTAFPATQTVLITDGTTSINGTVTGVAGSNLTVKTTAINAGSAGNTMGQGATVTFGGQSGATAFTGLTDAPANYTGAAQKLVRVNDTGTGLQFAPVYIDANGALWGNLQKVNAQTGNYTVTASDAGKSIVITSASNVVLTLPQQSTTALNQGFPVEVIQGGAGTISLALQGSDTAVGAGSSATTGGQGQSLKIMLLTAGTPNTWNVSVSGRALVQLNQANVYTKNQIITPVVNASASGTITPDVSQSDTFEYTMTGNLTIGTPTDSTNGGTVRDGTKANFWFKQDGVGSRTLALPSNFKPLGGVAPSMPTAAGARLYISAQYFATDSVWAYGGGSV